MKILDKLLNKLNPAQNYIVQDQGEDHVTSNKIRNFKNAYNTIEVVNRGTNLIVDSSADMLIDVGDTIKRVSPIVSISKVKLNTLLNYRPNPYYNANVLKRNLFIDLILDGNAFLYYDGAFLYNLPAENVEIKSSKTTYIEKYIVGDKQFLPNEIIHIKENSADTIFRGTSRLTASSNTIVILEYMLSHQENVFKNGAVPGLILKTENVLSAKVKERKLQEWRERYSIATKGGRNPMILDGDFDIDTIMKNSFSELEFSEGVEAQEIKILKTLGVPPILLVSGNNANISPNQKIFYSNTVIPLFNKLIYGLEAFFGIDLKINKHEVDALRPELKELSNYLTQLVNAGIMTRNEAREKIRLAKSDADFADDLVLPANIAGSAVNPGVGGKPPTNNNN